MQAIDCRNALPSGFGADDFQARALNPMSQGLGGSKILKIAGEIRAMQAAGRSVCNLTVGDFSPKEFPVPGELRDGITKALADGQTNYPPAVGLPETREAVRAQYERELGLLYPVDSVIMGSGARPPIYATFSLVVEAGDRVIYGIPSWNNGYYIHLSGAQPVGIPTGPQTDFLLTADAVRPHLPGTTLLCLNSPLNPCGTAYSEEGLGELCDLILEENKARLLAGKRPVMVLFDQVYWMLCFGGTKHHTPVGLRPEMAAYTIFVDAISKSFAATGLRVGWGVVPPALAPRYKAMIGHMGAWAPRPAQLATAALLNNTDAITRYHSTMKAEVEARLEALHTGFSVMAERGLPVRSIAPQGAIYLSVHFSVQGKSYRGETFSCDDDIRRFLLDAAGFGVVPFQAFGLEQDTGWMRLSIGSVSLADIEQGLERIEAALSELS